MSGVASNDDLRTEFGDFYLKKCWGLILKTTVHDMEVLLLGTSHHKGPMYLPDSKKRNCIGFAQEGTEYVCRDALNKVVPYQPARGVVHVSSDIEYKASVGVYADLTCTVRLAPDSRIWRHGDLDPEPLTQVYKLFVEVSIARLCAMLPATVAKEILEEQSDRTNEQIGLEEEQQRQQVVEKLRREEEERVAKEEEEVEYRRRQQEATEAEYAHRNNYFGDSRRDGAGTPRARRIDDHPPPVSHHFIVIVDWTGRCHAH
jgi:hypothetical protein